MATTPSPAYAQLGASLDNLVALLVDHPSMTAEVTLDTKPKNKVQLTYDYFTRLQSDLKSIDSSLPDSQKDQWLDVVQRTYKAQILICEQPRKLSELTHEEEGDELDFGDQIRDAASKLVQKQDEDESAIE